MPDNLKIADLDLFNNDLDRLPDKKILINTINAHCYNMAQNDPAYAEVLLNSDVLLPDGISIVIAKRILGGEKIRKIAGADLFSYEMERLNRSSGTCFFLGSNDGTLDRIKDHASKLYPDVRVFTYAPPYTKNFSLTDSQQMISAVNKYNPDVLFIGMTAPKQEKWAYEHFDQLNAGHICSIGAVFDFFAGNIRRAPEWMINMGLEWFYRLLNEPRRLWRRYLLGNIVYTRYMIREKLFLMANKAEEKEPVNT